MPWPANVTEQPGRVAVDMTFTASLSGAAATDVRVKDAVQRTFERLARQTGIPIRPHLVPADAGATLTVVVERRDHRPPQRLGDDERYSLEASNGRVRISADTPLGALRGIETFLQLVQQNTTGSGATPAEAGFSVPDVAIHDEPRFAWRGFSLDVSRHFIPLDEVKRTMDGMAAVKLNVLHWHLSDDQGFRIESKRYPRLQRYGSDGLYYTQAEIRDAIAYARLRGLRIVPEFDMPGHATSWLPGYPTLGAGQGPFQIAHEPGVLTALIDPTKESTYRFLDGFVGEMSKLFPDEYFHIGGDEVDPKEWNNSPRIQVFMKKHALANAAALQAYFNKRLLKIVSKHRKHMEGWDEILNPDLPKSIVIQSWRGQKSLAQAAQEGYQGILSAGYYLDLMQPASQHYTVDPMKGETADLTPEQSKRILGGEAAMWEELATSENLDAKLWPRLAAIAERLWSPESITDVTSMYRRMAITNHWLEWLGLTQCSNLELMRQRLAGTDPVKPLDEFASVLEPVKGYSRHAEKYTSFTPLNRLVDSISPESNTAREFRNAADRYLAGPRQEADAEILRKELATWSDTAKAVRRTLASNSLLLEDIPVADSLVRLCQSGQEALSSLNSRHPANSDWKQRNLAAIGDAAKPQADMLIQIAPAIQKLVDAVQTTQ
ncbi:MAG: beta-N-acetylhexosaminidase [Bryobacteraceae bacterium]